MTINNNHTLDPFKELGLDFQGAKKHAFKLHVHSVNYAAKLVHTRRALSSTTINSHQEPVSGQVCNPPDPHWPFSVSLWWRNFSVPGTQSGYFSLINAGSCFLCLCSFLSYLRLGLFWGSNICQIHVLITTWDIRLLFWYSFKIILQGK